MGELIFIFHLGRTDEICNKSHNAASYHAMEKRQYISTTNRPSLSEDETKWGALKDHREKKGSTRQKKGSRADIMLQRERKELKIKKQKLSYSAMFN